MSHLRRTVNSRLAMWQEALKEYNQTSTAGPANVDVSASSGVWTNQYIQQSKLSG